MDKTADPAAEPTAEPVAAPDRPRRLTKRKRVADILQRVLDSSVADETEIVWFERRHGEANTRPRSSHLESPRITVLIRVVEGRRLGWHRTDVTDPSQLEGAVRHALAVATAQPRLRGGDRLLPRPDASPEGPDAEQSAESGPPIRDRSIETLDADAAAQLLGDWCGGEASQADGVEGKLHYSRTHLAVWNSHGLRRHVASTEVTFSVTVGDGIGRGYAAASARTLEALDPVGTLERARSRASDVGDVATPPTSPVTAVLAPEAVIELLDIANTFAFAGRAYLDGTSFLTQHRGVQVFDRAVHVRDDPSRTPGMPFPFDLEGVTKRPVDLIVEGRASTPALNRVQGGAAGLEPTGQSVGGEDAMFGNLFVLPGHQDLTELLGRADGGVFISHLERPECYDPKRLGIRAVACGVRRIENGQLGAPLPDLAWETSLLAAFARISGIGRHPVVRAMPSTPLGGICAPAFALADAGGFTAVSDESTTP
ncbi:MAG: metallopeptidase TldD-related protein [Acidobacteriota bacterium]